MISTIYGLIYRSPKHKRSGKKKKPPRIPYAEYLASDYWRRVREAKFLYSGRQCQVCGATSGLEIHHRTYAHRGRELHHLDDLAVYCRSCHERAHRATITRKPC